MSPLPVFGPLNRALDLDLNQLFLRAGLYQLRRTRLHTSASSCSSASRLRISKYSTIFIGARVLKTQYTIAAQDHLQPTTRVRC